MVVGLLLGFVIFGSAVVLGLSVSYIAAPVGSSGVSSSSSELGSSGCSGAVPSLLGAIATEVTFVSTTITSDCPYVEPVSSPPSSWG